MLDAQDRAILAIVQRDNRLSNQAIAEQVNLSETAVRRRLTRLRSEGVIQSDVVVLDRSRLGQTLIVAVTFHDDTPETYERFRIVMAEDPQVTTLYSVAGETDFILHVHAPSLEAYESWAEASLLSDPTVRRYETTVVLSTIKFTTKVPV
ncbi:Lrp/AsnC family transcriptional regulator [Oceanicaulis sp. MMSF_3324]|uniref:Lrp/AsnC family transcriptional regulator n=1 Tax=Oceanicaulis sp. MMSF_3324 TaxID=3046702 RepID=UPI00273D4714|nr:Lrp/AsnC family transcriptional regulator [Oceanicaulis sp. MMSF_3324]